MRRVSKALLIALSVAMVAAPGFGSAAEKAPSLFDRTVDIIVDRFGYVPERVLLNGVETNTMDALALIRSNEDLLIPSASAAAQPADLGRGTRTGGYDCIIGTIVLAETFGFGPLPSPVPDAMVGETVSGLPGGTICGGIPYVRAGTASAAIDPGAMFQMACVAGTGAYWLVSPVDCYVGAGGSPFSTMTLYGNVGYVEYILDFFGFLWIHDEILFGGVQGGLPGAWEDASLITIE